MFAFLFLTAVAEGKSPLCVDSIQGKAYEINAGALGYFFRPVPGHGKLIGFSSPGNPQLIDIETGQRFPVPGALDPIATPDGKFISVVGNDTIDFYPTESILDKNANQVLSIKTSTSYQSIAGTGPNKSPPYKMLTVNGDRLSLITINSVNNKLIDAGETPLCPGRKLAAPWISGDGKYLSAFDTEGQVSVLIEISKGCKNVFEFNNPVGKGTFSPDNKKFAFHISGSGFDMIEKFNSNVYVLDIARGKITPLSNNLGLNNSVYPGFLDNDNVLFMNADRQSSSAHPVFREVDLNQANAKFDFFCNPAPADQFQKIGALYLAVCSDYLKAMSQKSMFPLHASLIGRTVTKANCQALMKEVDDKALKLANVAGSAFLDLEKKELNTLCNSIDK